MIAKSNSQESRVSSNDQKFRIQEQSTDSAQNADERILTHAIEYESLQPLIKLTESYSFSTEDMEVLKSHLSKYKQICQIQKTETKEEQIRKLGQQCLRFSNELHQRHIKTTKMMEVLFNQSFNLNKLKCNGLNFDEVKQVASKVKMACEQDLGAFYFLSFYLKKCVTNLDRRGTSVKEIERFLKETLKNLKRLHPPNYNTPSSNLIHQIASKTEIQEQRVRHSTTVCRKPSHNIDLIKFGFTKRIRDQLKINLADLQNSARQTESRNFKVRSARKAILRAEQKISEFEKTSHMLFKKESQEKPKQLVLNLKGVLNSQKVEKLQLFIASIAKSARQNLSLLTSLTKQACLNNNGLHYKTDLKIKDVSNISSINRVKQKLLSRRFKKLEIPEKVEGLSQFIKGELQAYDLQMDRIFEQNQESIKFTVSDMLRGKCMFREIGQINKAAHQIIELCQQQGFRVVEIDNRLDKMTTDLVLKIDIKGIISEFQLAYKFNVTKNQFNHKLYELVRSNFFTIISTLEDFNQVGIPKLNQFRRKIQAAQNIETDLRTSFDKEQRESFQNLSQEFENWLKQNGQSTHSQKNSGNCNQIKEILSNIKNVPSATPQYFYLSSIYLREMAEYPKAYEKVTKAENLLTAQEVFATEQTSTQLIKILHLKADILRDLGRDNEQIEVRKKVLDIISRNRGESETISLMVGQEKLCIGSIYRNQGNYCNALEIYRESQDIYFKIKGRLSVEYAQILAKIGLVYQMKGEFARALQYLEESLQIKQKVSGKDSIELTENLHHIGRIFREEGKYDWALNYFQQCLDIQTKSKGSDSIHCAFILQQMGVLYSKTKFYKQALSCYQETLEIERRVKGKMSSDYATTLNNIGLVFNHQGNPQQALKYLEQSLKIKEEIKGEDSICCAPALNNIAFIYKAMGKKEVAIEYYSKCLKIKRRAKGRCSIDCSITLTNMGLAYCSINDFQRALQCLVESKNILEQIKGRKSTSYCTALSNIGFVHRSQGNYPKAIESYRQCLSILEDIKGRFSIQCAIAFSNLGLTLTADKQYSQAIKNYEISLEIRLKISSSNFVEQARVINHMGIVYKDQAMYEKAISVFEKAISVLQKAQNIQIGNYQNMYKALQRNVQICSRKLLGESFKSNLSRLPSLNLRNKTDSRVKNSCDS